MKVELVLGGFLTQLCSSSDRSGTGIINEDIESVDTMLKKTHREGYGLASDCTEGLRNSIDRIIKRYLPSGNSPAKKIGLSQILYVINKRLPNIRNYYGENSYSEAARALIVYLEDQKIAIEAAL